MTKEFQILKKVVEMCNDILVNTANTVENSVAKRIAHSGLKGCQNLSRIFTIGFILLIIFIIWLKYKNNKEKQHHNL